MIGVLITGHGEFATGLGQAAQMIAGPQENYLLVPFEEGMNLDNYRDELKNALEQLSAENSNGVVVLTDILGGTPFREGVVLSQEFENIEILTGTNLAMIVEILLTRPGIEIVEEFAKSVVITGKDSIQHLNKSSLEGTVDSGADDEI